MKTNKENSSKREFEVNKEEIDTDLANGYINTTNTTSKVTNTTPNDPKKADYHNGYVQGEISENHREADVKKVRDNDNIARGLLLGIIIASVVGLVLSTAYFLNRRDDAPILVPLVVPVPRANQPSPPSNSTRTIEREKTIIEKIVPVPQASPVQKASPAPQVNPAPKVAPAPQVNPAPNITITVPNSQRQDAPVQQAPTPSSPNSQKETTPSPESSKAPASATPTPAPQSSKTPVSTQNNDATGVGTKGESNTEKRTDSNPSNTPTPDSNSGVNDGAAGSQ